MACNILHKKGFRSLKVLFPPSHSIESKKIIHWRLWTGIIFDVRCFLLLKLKAMQFTGDWKEKCSLLEPRGPLRTHQVIGLSPTERSNLHFKFPGRSTQYFCTIVARRYKIRLALRYCGIICLKLMQNEGYSRVINFQTQFVPVIVRKNFVRTSYAFKIWYNIKRSLIRICIQTTHVSEIRLSDTFPPTMLFSILLHFLFELFMTFKNGFIRPSFSVMQSPSFCLHKLGHLYIIMMCSQDIASNSVSIRGRSIIYNNRSVIQLLIFYYHFSFWQTSLVLRKISVSLWMLRLSLDFSSNLFLELTFLSGFYRRLQTKYSEVLHSGCMKFGWTINESTYR